MNNKLLLSSIMFLLLGCKSSNIDTIYLDVIIDSIKNNNSNEASLQSPEDYSFIKISKGSNNAIFVLSAYKDGKATWVGSKNERIITVHGKIVKTIGFKNNYFARINTDSITKNYEGSFKYFVDFSNPRLINTPVESKFLDIKSSQLCNRSYIYEKIYINLGYKFQDIYCFKNGMEYKTLQHLSPIDKPYEIEFHFRF